jgi:uncharacterized membrane protein YfcA
MNPIALLLSTLAALAAVFLAGWTWLVRRIRREPGGATSPAGELAQPGVLYTAIGAVTNFFDTLGIGSFATTTAMWRVRRLVADELIPGTLNVGHTLPTVTQAFCYIGFIEVDVPTLVAMIAAAVLGAWLGAGVVARWPRRKIQIGMGLALLVAATLMLMSQLQLFPVGGEALGVRGVRLAIAVGGNFMLGALMTLGIGLYAPCMILVSLLGMNPRAAFPIMMGSCAFLMPVGSLRFIRERRYHLRAALGLALGGIPGVLVAAFIVKELPLGAIRWLVIVVVVYTATMMLRSAFTEREAAARAGALPSPLR